jgi:hypothetical protein
VTDEPIRPADEAAGERSSMRRPLMVSVLAHASVVLLALLLGPLSRREITPPPETAVVVDLVDVAAVTNLPPRSTAEAPPRPPTEAPAPEPPKGKPVPLQKAPEPIPEPVREASRPASPEPRPRPPQAAKPEPPKPEPPKEKATAARNETEPKPKPVESVTKKAEPIPETAPRPDPKVAKHEDKAANEEKKSPERPKPPAEPPARPKPEIAEKKPEPKSGPADKAAEKKPEPKPEPAADFASVLKTVEQLRQGRAEGDERSREPAVEQPRAPLREQVARALNAPPAGRYDPGSPMTVSEIDAVRRQIERCWAVPAGAKTAENLVVAIRVEMNLDGTPRTAHVENRSEMQGNPFYRAAAESALRAVLNPRCHPFRLPPEKYDRWRTMTLVFDPKEMFGT